MINRFYNLIRSKLNLGEIKLRNYTWLTARNTNKLHAIPTTVDGECKADVRSMCGIGAYTRWFVGKENQMKCKNCLRKLEVRDG